MLNDFKIDWDIKMDPIQCTGTYFLIYSLSSF